MRQKNDKQFAEALNRIRTSNHTEEDVQLIKSREIDMSSSSYPLFALHIFAFNRDINSHNLAMLDQLIGPVITIVAIDSKTDQQTGRIDTIVFDEKKKPGGMLQELKVAVGTRVMMTTNVNTADALVNSASGTVTGFIPDPPVMTTLSDIDLSIYWLTLMKREWEKVCGPNLGELYLIECLHQCLSMK
jgi:hypothetical protein